MQIYTRTGDQGNTKIIGGRTVEKNSPRVNAYGTVDELNSFVGVAASQAEDYPELQEELRGIQQYLFDCGNDLATPKGKYPYRVNKDMILWLESRIDAYADIPPVVESFILPGGTPLASALHVARTVTRRAEREIVTFLQTEESNPDVLRFMNRLSDYFFAVTRVANAKAGVSDILYERSGRVFHTEITKKNIMKLD